MKIWNFKEINDEFYFIWPGKENNNILSLDNDLLKVNKSKPEENELFQLIDIIE